MNIYDAIKENDARISIDDKWLVWYSWGEWAVYQRKYRAKVTKTLYCGSDENVAVKTLLGN